MCALSVTRLRCEYLENPLGLDEPHPRLSWALRTETLGARQTAYHLRVASSAALLENGEADLWDTGRVESNRSIQHAYRGEELTAGQACYWQVEVWNEAGKSVVSPVASWSMGMMGRSDWAQWIAAPSEVFERDPEATAGDLTTPSTPILYRKQFELPQGVRRATVYATARGLFELRLNGVKVGEDVFAPEWTDYDKRIQYRTYDVTAELREGANTLGAILGDGWWSGYVGWQETRGRYGSLENSLAVHLRIELENGEEVIVSTGPDWTCETGPILSSDFMMGEIYDARRERTGWDRAPFDDANWLPAKEVAAPAVPLVAQPSEPVRIFERLAPISCVELEPGVFIYDLGQNIAGWVHLRLTAAPGTRLTLRHAERLNPDGSLYTENLRRAKATDEIVVGPNGRINWQPRFTFHGFQYVELRGLETAPPEGSVVGCVVQSATPPSGTFRCSHEGVNRLWLNGVWSQKDNFLSVPTDCPQRDERLGWMGDAQAFLRTAAYNANVAAFFTKWMVDIEDAQTEDGVFPDTAPRLREGENFVGLDDLCGGPAWADAGIIIPYTIWQIYGDFRIVRKHWKAMVAWLEYLERTNPDYLRVNDLRNNYGDWLCIPSDREFRTHSPMKNLLATAYWAHGAALMVKMARALERDAEAAHFELMFDRIRSAFKAEFLNEDGSLKVATQTAYLLALEFNLLPMAMRPAAMNHLVRLIEENDWHLSTGFVGIRFINPVLTLNGRPDVAYRLLLQEGYPGWLYPVKHGATTIWERWNGWTEQDGFFDPLMNSFNHYSLGSVGEWLYRHVAGIELDPTYPGFQYFALVPYPGGGLTFAEATYETQYGTIRSSWQQDGDIFVWEFVVPPNCAAKVVIPCNAGEEVMLSGEPLRAMREGNRVITCFPAGRYTVSARYTG